MQPHANDNLTRRILLTLSMCFLLLVCTGCQIQDVTPEWWKSLPGGFLGWKEPLTRVLVLLIPWAIVGGIFGFVMNESVSGFLVSVLRLYFVILALALLGIIFLSTFSYGLTGQIYYVTYPFACFCAGCLLLALIAIALLALLGKLFSGGSVLEKGLGLLGLVLEGFGILFTIRDIYNLFVR